ncbi:PTS mannose/fructose/sorbose/N-acetylgalactosamine transporter subunit IIC [Clostridium perfringens]|uniref:PTS mannose/fructose/sorbose/N-acetylgalactosamine transporter subunit IIC n=1 Tax=Clostridium perfringens TaxID=1502 RepID=UPI00399CB3ED
MQEIGIIQILLLSVCAFLSINEMLGPYLGLWHRPLIAGFGAGLILGDIQTGLFVGATLEMMSLGVHSYGGAVVPDYTTGAILGVTFGYLTGSYESGIALGVPIALLGSYLDVLARLSTGICAHKADSHAANGNLKGMWRWHLFGSIPWGLSRAIPVFVGAFFGSEVATAFIEKVPVWLTNGFAAAGRAMPALGVAILLNYLPITKQWYFAIMGFILVCFLNLPMIAVGLIGLITAVIYVELYHKNDGAKVNNEEDFEQIGGEF